MKTYGKWIPDRSLKMGYRLANNWEQYIEISPLETLDYEEDDNLIEKSISYMGRRP